MKKNIYKRKAKIVCTLGPASSTEDEIYDLIMAGMDVVRLNFSHGDHAFHQESYDRVRKAAKKANKPVAIMQDLQGPKIRCRTMENKEGVLLVKGMKCIITTDNIVGTAKRFGTSYALLPQDVKADDVILLDDGNLSLKVVKVKNQDVHCEVIDGGYLKDRKGINLPFSKVSAPSLTVKDIEDAHFGAKLGVDAIALSFVRSAQDVRQLRRELFAVDSTFRPLLIAKIEKPQAVEQLEGILEEADGIMVARGDLGVEMPPEMVPVIQKNMVASAKKRGKLVIVATQMLESMITNPRPTRAEASDVANAILDGTDAVMLSGETAVGVNPCNVVATMSRIICETEKSDLSIRKRDENDLLSIQSNQNFQNAISYVAVRSAEELKAEAICTYTNSGQTARLIADYRPKVPILAFVPNESQRRRLSFAWGVTSIALDQIKSTKELLIKMDELLLEKKLARAGECVVLCLKIPLEEKQRTNTLNLHVVGSAKLSYPEGLNNKTVKVAAKSKK